MIKILARIPRALVRIFLPEYEKGDWKHFIGLGVILALLFITQIVEQLP